jgi:hypothetical protein
VARAFDTALAAHAARFGVEQARDCQDDSRAVVQFQVEPKLFDWFFNARTGYRAHFWAGSETGFLFNAKVVATLRTVLAKVLPDRVPARRLNANFEDCGETWAARDSIATSLDDHLSKIWACTRLIGLNAPPTILPLGVTGPKLEVAPGGPWPAIYRDASETWLDVKGAFVGSNGLYQPKDPILRARRLREHGTT